MNLVAASIVVPNLIFVATRAVIQCWWLNPVTLQCIKKGDSLKHPVTHADNPHFNHMVVGHLGSTEVLVAVDDAGRVVVWSTASLHPLAVLACAESAWGISLHPASYQIAVSCNAHTISVWDFSQDGIADFDQSSLTTSASAFATIVDKDPYRVLTGHSNNIPSISFNRDGSKLASVSIDHSCRVWDLQRGACISWTSLDQWGWQVQFIPNSGFFFDMLRNRASAANHASSTSTASPAPDLSSVSGNNDELILATTQNQAYLLSLSTTSPPTEATQHAAQPLRAPRISPSELCSLDRVFPDRPRFYYLLQMTRISMLHTLMPKLPLAVMANQVGQVAIVRLDMGYLDPPSPPPPPSASSPASGQDEQAQQAQVEADQIAAEDAAGGYGGLWSIGNELPDLSSEAHSQEHQVEPGQPVDDGNADVDHDVDDDEQDWDSADTLSLSSSSETDPLMLLDLGFDAGSSRSRPRQPAPHRTAPATTTPAPILTHSFSLLDRFPSITAPTASELPLYGLLVLPRQVVDPMASGEPQAAWPVYRIGAVNMDGSATWVDVGALSGSSCRLSVQPVTENESQGSADVGPEWEDGD